MNSRYTKIGADGQALAAAATAFVAILDTTTGLMWDVAESSEMNWDAAKNYAGDRTVAGFTDWRLPTIDELETLHDRTKWNPAIDNDAFPSCKSDWYWSSTPLASSPSVCAWFVYFDGGLSGWDFQYSECFVRAVRSSQ